VRSKLFAQDERNLMLMCYGCHKRIDCGGKASEYSEADLLAMKREHEARGELIYSSTGAKQTLPVLMTFPIGSHAPVIDIRDINHVAFHIRLLGGSGMNLTGQNHLIAILVWPNHSLDVCGGTGA
jgi:hypothetical protein